MVFCWFCEVFNLLKNRCSLGFSVFFSVRLQFCIVFWLFLLEKAGLFVLDGIGQQFFDLKHPKTIYNPSLSCG